LNFKAFIVIRASHQKSYIFNFNCGNLAIHMVTLAKIFSFNIKIVRYKILQFNTCLRPNIHQHNPKCLGISPKQGSPFFGPLLKFGQVIVDAIFVQKIPNFWWTCGLVLALRCTNFYKIPIYSDTIMPKNNNFGHASSFG
jgi:hypothetical protein